ncbi:MAG TPA: S-layer protein domain-containing protein [Methanotrichaceae archaeon]|nr:S-layer protein domain-containing protein [Methanotrichaceae archaeon]
MKKMAALMIMALVGVLATSMVVGAVDTVEIRGQVATDSFAWNPQNFAGFYYDLKKDLGTETLTTTITEGKKLSGDAPYGVIYQTTAQGKDFEFEDWGTYKIIGFMAQKYFAGYIENTENLGKNIMFKESSDENSLSDEQLQQILMDDDEEYTLTSGSPFKLEEGYELSIKSIDIDGNKVYLELMKDGKSVDTKVVSPSKDGATEADKTYYYKTDVGDQKDLVIIAIHFKNAFRGADQDIATIDGQWQISDSATEVKADTEYDKMTIRTVDATAGTITMDNKDNAITLSKNKDTLLMEKVHIKTADNDTLRYYIYKEETEPGDYEVRGQVATDSFSWNPQNFAGFYYDLKKDLGTETLTTAITEGKKLSGDAPYGVIYQTTAQGKDFEFEDWGTYKIIGFMAQKYFAGYIENTENLGKNIMFKESSDENSLSDEQLQQILMDDDEEYTLTSGSPFKLEEGYELSIKSIDIDGNKVYLELMKDGKSVDTKVVSPSKDGATEADKTYYYKTDVGDQKDLVIIAIHFKNAFRGADQDIATIDGQWQISDSATEVKADTEYDKMTIRTVDATTGTITMDNKDNAITLSKNKDSLLMGDVHIKTADNDTLRYYIYAAKTIEGAAAEAAPVEAEVPAEANVTAEAPVEEAPAAEAPAEAPAEEEKPAEAAAAEKPAEAAAEQKPAESQGMPGFEAIFAVTGLLAVAYLVNRKN